MIRSVLLVACAFGHLVGCMPARPALETYYWLDESAAPSHAALTADALAGLQRQLQTGDIILAATEDPITSIMRLATMTPTYFIHCGVVETIDAEESDPDGRPVRVWQAVGRFNVFHLSPHVLGKVRGGVSSVPLGEFIRQFDTLRVLRLPDQSKNKRTIESCRLFRAEGIEFDAFMDCFDSTSLCCTELIAEAMALAGYDVSVTPSPVTTDPTLSALFAELNITTQGIIMAGQFEDLPDMAPVTVISRYDRIETYLAMHDAAYLIHEKFEDRVIALHDIAGVYRDRMMAHTDRMQLFLRGVEGLAKASPTSDATEIRRRNEAVFRTVFEIKRSGSDPTQWRPVRHAETALLS